MHRLFFASVLLFASSAFAAGAPNITGHWSIHNVIAGNENDRDCKLVQTDNKITGSCKSEDGEVPITGSVDGNKATWSYGSEYNGTPLTLTYTASLDESGTISGSVDVQPFGVTGEFTATPWKEPAK